MIEIPAEQLMFLGDNALNGRFGQMTHATFKGNIAALDLAIETGTKHYVPGHGALGGSAMVEEYKNYLVTLRTEVSTLLDDGLADYEMKPSLLEKLSSYRDWVGFDGEFGRHISLVYLEVENEMF
jgi:hypothetical protein